MNLFIVDRDDLGSKGNELLEYIGNKFDDEISLILTLKVAQKSMLKPLVLIYLIASVNFILNIKALSVLVVFYSLFMLGLVFFETSVDNKLTNLIYDTIKNRDMYKGLVTNDDIFIEYTDEGTCKVEFNSYLGGMVHYLETHILKEGIDRKKIYRYTKRVFRFYTLAEFKHKEDMYTFIIWED